MRRSLLARSVALAALCAAAPGCRSPNSQATVRSDDEVVAAPSDAPVPIPSSPGDTPAADAPPPGDTTARSNPLVLDAELGEAASEGEEKLIGEIADAIKSQINKDYPPSNRPARRDAHPKAHGCVKADFTVKDDVPANLAQGIFVPGKSYKAWIRFSNGASDQTRPDGKGDARGMAIKVIGVPGDKLLPAERAEQTQDFIMINHPVFFVDSPKTYLSVIKKIGSTNPLVNATAPVALGLKGAAIALQITSKKIASPLETRFWSMVPYRLGDDQHKQAIKFSAMPCNAPAAKMPKNPGPNFLREAMIKQLQEQDYCFEFMVQPRSTPSMSVENSMTEWKETEAPFVKVATIHIPKQAFAIAAQDTFCDNLSYTPWHALPEHRPLGAVNRTRRVVYEEISKLRHGLNEAPRGEPTGDETFQ